jgi:type IV secretion system protein VirB11
MRPDRIMLAEVRDEECFFFVRSAASGHPGSMTTLHAGSTEEAFAQMALMIRQSPGGAGLAFSEIDRLLRMTVDVVVQFGNDPARGRHISGLYYEPQRRMRAALGELA